MDRKKKYFYYISMVVLIIFLLVIYITAISKQTGYGQKDTESELPEMQRKQNIKTKNIRVLLKTNGFKQIAHPSITVKASKGLKIISGEKIEEIAGEEQCSLSADDDLFQKGIIRIQTMEAEDKIAITSIERGYGIPTYRGILELYATAEGIVVVNELNLEEYLYAVVPSEMPASYEFEALKVQAVCARSYAYCQSENYAYPEYKAHVDDSTSYQVYGNSKEQDATTKAVDETAGETVIYKGKTVRTYYYSTSCGYSAGIEAWGSKNNDKNAYLKSISVCDGDGNAYEKELPWYRWTATIPENELSNAIELNTGTEIGTLTNVKVTRQGQGGIVLEIKAIGTTGEVTVTTENKIRRALGGTGCEIKKQDGSSTQSTSLLPSAFFTITKSNGCYVIKGGGYGHGIGMSQNGANEMAKEGKTYQEILKLFYTGVTVQ